MKVKKIILMENETVIDALIPLKGTLSNANILIDSSCKYRIRNHSFEEITSSNYLKLKFYKDDPLHRTEVAMFKLEKWYDIDAIYSRELIYVRPENPEYIIYITTSSKQDTAYKRINLKDSENPIDFILSLKEKAKSYTFILPEYIIFRILVDNRGQKTVISKKDSIQISWENGDFCLLQKQRNSNEYVLLGLSINNFNLNKINGDFVYLV